MSKINKLSKKIIIYTTSLILSVTLIFTVVSMSALIMFKKYTINKTENTFKDNANRNLEREVVFYAKILKKAMESRSKTVFMFGKMLDKEIEAYKNCKNKNFLTDIYEEMNQSFDIRDIEILNSNFEVLCKFPEYIDTSSMSDLLKEAIKPEGEFASRIKYIDFHKNSDNSVSYSYVYLTKANDKSPIFVVFDFNPYGVYSLIKTAQLYPYSQKYLWVINKKGVLIYDPPTKNHPLITLLDNVDLKNPKNGLALSEIVKNKILKGGTGVSRYIFRNVDKFVGYTYIKELGWGLGLTLPTEEFYAPITNLSRDIDVKTIHTLSILSIVNAIIILIGVTVAMFVSKKITSPINKTIEAIDALIKEGELKKLSIEGDDELKELALSVNKLMDFFDKACANTDKTKGGLNG